MNHSLAWNRLSAIKRCQNRGAVFTASPPSPRTVARMEQSLQTSLSLNYRQAGNIDPAKFGNAKKECILFYHPSCQALADKIAATSESVTLGQISWGKFNDGFPNVFVKDALNIRNCNVAFLASFHTPAVEAEGEVATAFTLARMLSNIPLTRGGPASVVIFDIHALQERFYFGDSALPLFESGIPLLLDRLKLLPDADSVTIAYPDEGAWKRFHFQFQDYPELICTKVRDGDKRIVRLKEGDAAGRHVVIVDDLVQSGGTLIECGRLLHSLGASHVSAYVTHGVFPNKSYERFKVECTAAEGHREGWAHLWITDSCPETALAVAELEPFEVLSLAEPIANALMV